MTYGVVSKGNGDCFLMEETHTSLSIGGGQAGQGYPCILLYHHIPKVTEIAKDQNNCQTLISRAGTGGGNVPLIMMKDERKKTK